MPKRPCVRSAVFWRDPLLVGLFLGGVLVGPSLPLQAGSDDFRDPFVFGPREGAVRQAGTSLIGILWDTTSPLAMVGDQTVGVGDTVAGWTVVQIQEGAMVIRRDDRQEIITPGNTLPND